MYVGVLGGFLVHTVDAGNNFSLQFALSEYHTSRKFGIKTLVIDGELAIRLQYSDHQILGFIHLSE
jgi:hypothetical protein